MNKSKRIAVLVAEDSEDNRFLLQTYCLGTVYDLTFAEDGDRAVKAYEAEPFEIVVMDIQMPVMDGLAATRRMRSIETSRGGKRIPILALSANALKQDVARAREAGCNTHLAKPISKKDFLKALEDWQMNPLTNEVDCVIEIPEGLEELAQSYLAGRRRELPVFEDLLKRSDFAEIRRLAHNLKGTGTSYGFPDITRLGASIEQASKSKDLRDVATNMAALSAYVAAASRQLQGTS